MNIVKIENDEFIEGELEKTTKNTLFREMVD